MEKARELYGKNLEMDELLLANFTKKELTKSILPKSWEEFCRGDNFSHLTGCYIDPQSDIIEYPSGVKVLTSNDGNEGVFKTSKQAASALAMAQLSQLMYIYNDGWEPNWSDNQLKYCIRRCDMRFGIVEFRETYHFLAFKNKELAIEFLKNFEPLIKEYYMI